MTWIYLASLLFGAIFLVPMILGGLELDGDADFDLDAYGDIDSDLDLDFGGSDVDGLGSALGSFVSSILSFRNWVFFGAFFGGSGLIFNNLLDRTAALSLILALALGLTAAVANAALTRFVKTNVSDSQVMLRDLKGTPAQVVIPLGENRKGRIQVRVGDETTYMVALPYRESAQPFGVGDEVVVVEIADGTALVAPLPSLGSGESER